MEMMLAAVLTWYIEREANKQGNDRGRRGGKQEQLTHWNHNSKEPAFYCKYFIHSQKHGYLVIQGVETNARWKESREKSNLNANPRRWNRLLFTRLLFRASYNETLTIKWKLISHEANISFIRKYYHHLKLFTAVRLDSLPRIHTRITICLAWSDSSIIQFDWRNLKYYSTSSLGLWKMFRMTWNPYQKMNPNWITTELLQWDQLSRKVKSYP